VGISPGADNQALAGLLGVGLDECGFFAAADGLDNTRTAREGVFLAGTSQGPRDIADSVAHASRAAWEAAKYLGV
jgi:heterodisulfide reductase subunit A